MTDCIHHQKTLTYFCETCKEPTCQDCMVLGPHQTRNHILIQLDEAYRNRSQYIKERIEVHLLKRKEELVDHLKKIDDRMHEIQTQSVVIEKDVIMEFEGGIIKRLGDSKGQKLALLQKDIAQLQKNINDIDDFIQTFEYLALTEENVLPLLFMSKSFSKEMMRLLSIVVKDQIDVTPFDLPRELLALRTDLKNSTTLAEQIKFKKEVAWKSRQEKMQQLKLIKDNFFEKMEGEIMEWLRLVKRIVQAFDSLCLICSFCGCFLSQDIVNDECKMNHKPYDASINTFTDKQPKEKHYGTHQHYYADPKPQILKKDKYPDYGEYYEQRVAAKEIYLRFFRTLWFSILDLKARKYLKQYDLEQIFAKYDKEKTGWLSLVKFRYLLHKDLEMSVQEVEQLVNFFKDEKEDKINYQYFLEVDWYLDELLRLEENLQAESSKYVKLYGPKATRKPRSKTPTEEKKPVPQPRRPEVNLQPVYPYGIRFTQTEKSSKPPSSLIDIGFGFKGPERGQLEQALQNSQIISQQREEEGRSNFARSTSLQQRTQPLKSILKSSSPGAPASRFNITQPASISQSYLYKFYQQ